MKKKSDIQIIVAVAICFVLLLHVNHLSFVCDDAFISFRYAKNLAQGNGLVFNVGERVEGYSNFLWVLLLSLLVKLGLNVVVLSKGLAVLFSLFTILLLLRFSRLLNPKDDIFNYLAALLLACCGAYAAWSTGGLETSFFTFLLTSGSFFLVWGIIKKRGFVVSGIVFALLCMTRLDGLIFAGVSFAFLLYLSIVKRRIELRKVWMACLCFLLPFLSYFIWRWSYYGKLLPNTFYIKLGDNSLYHQGLIYLFDFLNRFWIWLMVVPLFFLGRALKHNKNLKPVAFYFSSMILVFCLYVIYVGGDFMDMFRFLVPILPLFFFLVQEGFRGMYYHGKFISKQKRTPILIVSQVLLTALILFLLVLPSGKSNEIWIGLQWTA
jgi:arabinofuranosyltransferase